MALAQEYNHLNFKKFDNFLCDLSLCPADRMTQGLLCSAMNCACPCSDEALDILLLDSPWMFSCQFLLYRLQMEQAKCGGECFGAGDSDLPFLRSRWRPCRSCRAAILCQGEHHLVSGICRETICSSARYEVHRVVARVPMRAICDLQRISSGQCRDGRRQSGSPGL